MKENLSNKDWIEISAYLDGRLNPSAVDRMKSRLESDPQIRKAFFEIKHTRRLLHSLPAKRAPHNFTLSQQFDKVSKRRWGLSSSFGLASAATALALVVLFFSNNFFAPSFSAAPALMEAPSAKEVAAETSLDTGAAVDADAEDAPMIVTWNNPQQAYGMGGGGDASDAVVMEAAPVVGAQEPDGGEFTLLATQPAEAALLTGEESAQVDPSTLILGLPEPGSGGEMIERGAPEPVSVGRVVPPVTLWMIGLGVTALVLGLLAIILRRR